MYQKLRIINFCITDSVYNKFLNYQNVGYKFYGLTNLLLRFITQKIIIESPKLQILKGIVHSEICWTNNEVKKHGAEMTAILEKEMNNCQNSINSSK